MPQNLLSAAEIIELLKLEPHPEGGFYRQTFADGAQTGARPASTLIYFLLRQGDVSAWHRVDAVEVWHYYCGAPIELKLSQNGSRSIHLLGTDLLNGERPQCVVPAHVWQSARSMGAWTLVGCTVAPGFDFSGFELAAPNHTL